MTNLITAELVYYTPVVCGECPVWDEQQKKLCWADLVNPHVYIFDPDSGANTRFYIGKIIGALALREKGGLILALETGFNYFDPLTGKLEAKSHPEAGLPGHFFGDGKCDAQGRFWAGTYHQAITDPVGSLYSLETDLTVTKRFSKVILSNGLAWSNDQKKFYYVDSIARRVYRFDYDATSGNISNPEILREFDKGLTLPDGLTVDRDGYLWVALFNAGKVIRMHPESAETVFEVLVPHAKQVTSCTFGGRNFDELYITTAKEVDGPYGIPEHELAAQSNAGGLFRARLPFKGLPPARFKG